MLQRFEVKKTTQNERKIDKTPKIETMSIDAAVKGSSNQLS